MNNNININVSIFRSIAISNVLTKYNV